MDDPAFDATAGMAPINVEDFAVARTRPEEYRAFLRPDVLQIKADPEAFLEMILAQMPTADRVAVESPAMREQVHRQWQEAVLQDEEGMAEDGLAFAGTWGFDPEAVAGEVKLWQGELDTLVPRSHGEYLAGKIPNATFELVPGEGHMIFGAMRPAFECAAQDPGRPGHRSRTGRPRCRPRSPPRPRSRARTGARLRPPPRGCVAARVRDRPWHGRCRRSGRRA
jgi:hypothetical protein